MLVDFHMHSVYSDGIETPKELLRHALDCNVSMMALTDHDEIDGIKALRTAQQELDPNETIKIINGCEFSADYKDKSIHILGYCFDENNKELNEFITFFKRKREERVDEMIRRCNIEGYHITKEEIFVFGNGENDISMLSQTKNSVAVENAQDLVKKQANYLCQSNLDDGVAKFIRKKIL